MAILILVAVWTIIAIAILLILGRLIKNGNRNDPSISASPKPEHSGVQINR